MAKLSRHRGETASPTRSTPLLSWFLEAVLGNGLGRLAMRLFSMFAVALSVAFLGSALPASAHCYGGYVSNCDRCVCGPNYYAAGYYRRHCSYACFATMRFCR
jgi:hypothetical protein